ncbi:MAG: two-component regulator propeller domain-containing protein [Gemmatimonadota bacterium]|jgi:signal transduction histidine kinase/ligand-binding sensor domain-containing protein
MDATVPDRRSSLDIRREGSRGSRRRPAWLAGALALAGMLPGTGSAAAQVINFRHYTRLEGLPQAQVLGMYQDARGYMWFATYGGLTRFNGAEFRTWTTDDGLTSNAVLDVTGDARGRIIVATSAGFCILEDDTFHCYRSGQGLASDAAESVAVDADGGIWIGTRSGLSYFRDGFFRNFGTAEGLPSGTVTRVAVGRNGRVWVGTDRGLARFQGGRFVPDYPEFFGGANVRFAMPAANGVVVGTANDLFLRRDDGVVPLAGNALGPGTTPYDAAVDSDGTIWVATSAGALRIGHDSVEVLTEANGLLTDMLLRVMVDREGDVWFGTESGASKHVPGPFATYGTRSGLPNPFVRALELDDQGRLWAGTRDGVAVREGGRFRTIDLSAAPDQRVYALARAAGGGILIGTRLGLIHYEGGRMRVYRLRDGLPGEVVYSLLADGRGGVWIGTDHGLARWANGRITPQDGLDLASPSVISMAEDEFGRLWLGHLAGGASLVDGDVVTHMGPEEGVTDQSVWAIASDREGGMWLGTNGDGALLVRPDRIERWTHREGLSSDFVWQVLPDSRGDVWFFGVDGLDRWSAGRITHYGLGSGLIELEGSATAAHEDARGDIWFGTGAGVIRYVPGLDVPSAIAPPIYVESVTRDGESVPLADGSARLDRGVVQIRFASPSFRDESQIRYRYRLIGANGDWSAPTTEHSLTYASLPPGRYRFQAEALSQGLASEDVASFAFEVLPAFWQRWWVRVIGLLLLSSTLAIVPVLRSRRLERERRRLEALVEKHTRDLAEKNERLLESNRELEHFAYVASHDLQEPLRKIRAFSDRITRRYTSLLDEQGRDYLGRMSSAAARMQTLIDDLLSLSRVTTRQREAEPIDLNALALDVVGDLEVRLRTTDGRVELGDLPTIEGDPVQIRQIFQNLIGNALKFHRPDEAPVVRVGSVPTRPGAVELRFEDNGIGFDSADAERVFQPFQRLHSRQEYEGTGIGLAICRKIAERHRGSIRVESSPGKGSVFTVSLPARQQGALNHAA